ncbi:hypothetical protein FJZ19_01605 [Candidatus Pacearchaeota archaeon]|nr:hypothetical protein [Candidatus Pacearchaeota archaeon]
MFEKLSSAIKKATDKIANAIFLDKNIVESIIKDLQRALIEADVNIHLVKNLSDELRKAAFDERIKGIEKKEHIIKLLHDKLLEILGGSQKELELEKNKNIKIMLLGLYGAGKCVHKDTKIQLSTGELIKAEKLYDKYLFLRESYLEDGKIIDISSQELFVPSFNPKTCKIENKKATHLWKLKKKELYEVKIDNGNDFSIRVTPEHPFFALKEGKIIQIRADELTKENFIAIPEKIEISGIPQSIRNKIKTLNLDLCLTKKQVQEIIRDKEIKEICKSLKCQKNYCCFTISLREGQVPIELVSLENFNIITAKLKNSKNIISIPLTINPEFAEFLGYLMGDGHIGKQYIEIVSEDKEIIERLTYLGKNLFNTAPKIKRDLRTNKMFRVIFCSTTLVKLLEIFKLKAGRKGTNMEVPEEILKSDNEVVKSFIKAYFDCDGSPSKGSRQIELTSESKTLIQQISFLLKRFSISSSISCKKVNGKDYCRMIISGRSSERYAEKIGSVIFHKKENLSKFQLYGQIQGSGRNEMIPLGDYLKNIREMGGFSIGEIQSAVNSYGRYEEAGFISKEQLIKLVLYYETKRLGIFPIILNKLNHNETINHNILNGMITHLQKAGFINKSNILTSIGNKYLASINQEHFLKELNNLRILAYSDAKWGQISDIKKLENDENYVYDLTIEDNHSFIADNFIVHNTTTISKLAAYYNKRGFKTAALGLDVHRPAAREQLEQLGNKNNFKVFIDKEENNPIKTWKKFSRELNQYDLIFVDTAGRDALDKDLINEIKKLGRELKPDYTILVMPADIGQAAKKQASEFQKALSINGVIITRMDSTAKGGGALTACHETKAPVYFITTGEHVHDIELFNPSSFLSRMLGMGDLQSLIERVSSVVDEKKQKQMQERLKEGKFTMLDLLEQLKSMENIGSLSKIKNLIPGLGNAKIPENMLENQEEKIKKWKFAIQSMTREEIENPEIIEKQTSRIARIAKGSGINTSDVRALLKQYKMISSFIKDGDMSEMQQGFSQKQMLKLAKKFGRKIRM